MNIGPRVGRIPRRQARCAGHRLTPLSQPRKEFHMTDQDPNEKELESAEAEVEGHSIDEEEEGEAALLNVNFGCHEK